MWIVISVIAACAWTLLNLVGGERELRLRELDAFFHPAAPADEPKPAAKH